VTCHQVFAFEDYNTGFCQHKLDSSFSISRATILKTLTFNTILHYKVKNAIVEELMRG